VCDVCKRQDYDQKALSQVYLMLSSNLGKPVERGRKGKPSKIAGAQSRGVHQSNK